MISADVCNALFSVIDNIVFFVLPVYNYFSCIEILRRSVKC